MSNYNEKMSFSQAHYRLIFQEEGGVTDKALERCAFAAMRIVQNRINEISGTGLISHIPFSFYPEMEGYMGLMRWAQMRIGLELGTSIL